jgi:hypothetical protein
VYANGIFQQMSLKCREILQIVYQSLKKSEHTTAVAVLRLNFCILNAASSKSTTCWKNDWPKMLPSQYGGHGNESVKTASTVICIFISMKPAETVGTQQL